MKEVARTRTPTGIAALNRTEIASQQFINELVRRNQRAIEDKRLAQAWLARRPAIEAAERKERKVLLIAALIGALVGLGLAALVVYWLMSFGLPLMLVLLLAFLLIPSSSGGCCLVIVTVIH